jgi:hypothetical protein
MRVLSKESADFSSKNFGSLKAVGWQMQSTETKLSAKYPVSVQCPSQMRD